MKKCKLCKESFEPKRPNQEFCDAKCRNKNGSRNWALKNKKLCVCGNGMKFNSKLCVTCSRSLKQNSEITIGQYRNMLSVKGKHPSWVNAHVRNFNRSWNKSLMGLPCQKCGYSNHTELAHIKAVSTYSDDTLLSVVNDPNNILVLCPNHHWEFDNALLNLEDIPERK